MASSAATRVRELDALVELAARVAGVPYAAVNLFSNDVQHEDLGICEDVQRGLPVVVRMMTRVEQVQVMLYFFSTSGRTPDMKVARM